MRAASLLLALTLAGCAGAPLPPNQNPMLVGRWASEEPGSRCVEQFDFRPDGTVTYSSGAGARVDGNYVLSPNPSARGLYALLLRLTSSNGGKDCQGEAAAGDAGDSNSMYVWIDPGKDLMLGCAEDNFDFCDRPLRRVR